MTGHQRLAPSFGFVWPSGHATALFGCFVAATGRCGRDCRSLRWWSGCAVALVAATGLSLRSPLGGQRSFPAAGRSAVSAAPAAATARPSQPFSGGPLGNILPARGRPVVRPRFRCGALLPDHREARAARDRPLIGRTATDDFRHRALQVAARHSMLARARRAGADRDDDIMRRPGAGPGRKPRGSGRCTRPGTRLRPAAGSYPMTHRGSARKDSAIGCISCSASCPVAVTRSNRPASLTSRWSSTAGTDVWPADARGCR